MKMIKLMPFNSIIDDTTMEVALWKSKENICEFSDRNAPVSSDGNCDNSDMFYGTNDDIEPKFCARHFYQLIVNGDGTTNYRLDDITDER